MCMMFFGFLFLVIFLMLVILGIWILYKYLYHPDKLLKHKSNAINILDERYARGEISKEEYNKIKEEISRKNSGNVQSSV